MKTPPYTGRIINIAKAPLSYLGSLKGKSPKSGDLVEDRGVYLGEWEVAKGHVVHAYAADDFLRDAKGQQLFLTYHEATKELTRRNGGWKACNGTEADLRAEIAAGGSEFEGKLVLPSKELLHGRNVYGDATRPDANIYALMIDGKIPKLAAAVQNNKDDPRWALSGSEHPHHTSYVSHASLLYGVYNWDFKDSFLSGVVPVRLYRSPKAVGPVPQISG